MGIKGQLGEVVGDKLVEAFGPGAVVAMVQANGEVGLEELNARIATAHVVGEIGSVVEEAAGAEAAIFHDMMEATGPAPSPLIKGPTAGDDGRLVLGFALGALQG